MCVSVPGNELMCWLLSRSPQHQRLIRVAVHMDKLEVDENSQVSAPH